MVFTRRWKGFTKKEVSERMSAVRSHQKQSKEQIAERIALMVNARGKTWKLIDGKRVYAKR